MRKPVLSMFVAAAMCAPTIATASHLNLPSSMMMMEYNSEDDCESALAMARNAERKSGRYEGKEKGMYNKAFNARYQCYEKMNGKYMIMDNGS
jgi:hypothetical protein